MNGHKELSSLYRVNKVFKLCIRREYLVTTKPIENHVKILFDDVIHVVTSLIFKCHTLQPKDRAWPNDQLLKVSSSSN